MSMKNYDERIESIFRKYNEKLEKKRRKTALIHRISFCASGLCAAVIVCALALKVPKDYFDYNYDNIVDSTENVTDETVTDSGSSNVQTTVSSVHSSITEQTTTSFVQTHTTSDITKTDVPVTTQSCTASATTSAASSSTTESRNTETTATTLTTTASQTDISATTSSTTTTDDGKSEGITPPPTETPLISYGGNTYIIYKDRINANKTGEVFAESLFTSNPIDLSPAMANLAQIKGFSPDYAAAAQINSEYYYCRSVSYQPQSLQSFFSDISLETNWDTSVWNFEYANNEKEVLFRLLRSIPDTVCVDSDYAGNEIYYKDIYSDIKAVPDMRISFTSKGYMIVRSETYTDKYFIGEDKQIHEVKETC